MKTAVVTRNTLSVSALSRRPVVAPRVARAVKRRAHVAEGAGSEVEPRVAPPRRATGANKPSSSDGSGYLTMYFRDMSALHVLRPLEEFTAAREFEALECELWRQLLSVPSLVPVILDAVEPVGPGLAEAKAVRKIAAEGKARDSRYDKAVSRCATKLREADADRLLVAAALRAVDRMERRGPTMARTLGRTRGAAAWLRGVRGAARAVEVARNNFVKANLRLVISIARRFNHGRMSLADLIQEGNLGLIKAVERYDHRRGFRFSTYASWWIRHAISRALADKGREIRLPVHMIDAHHRLTKARRELTATLGRPPSTAELAVATGMPVDKVENMRRWVLEQSVSIDRPSNDDDGRNLAETIEDPDREVSSPIADLEWFELTAEVRTLLDQLLPIEADILRQRFGLETDQELTLKEIGEKYNLSRERIRQLQEQALEKMRRALQRKDLF